LAHHGHKLEQLQQGQRRLPPDRNRLFCPGDLGVHADKVVGVHDCVDESIQEYSHVNISIVVDVSVEPVEQKNGCVMVHMKEGKLPPLLPDDNEKGVPKVPHLGHIKQPKQLSYGRLVL
jgi:hypothetical protein